MKQEKVLTQFDKMTKTPVPRLILGLSIPAILSMMVTNIYNLVDTAFVGQMGTSASGAVGVVFGYMSILQAVGFLFGQGAGSILSRSLGQKDGKTASLYASAGFFGSLFFGALIAGICLCCLDPLVRLLGSTETIAPYAKTYIFYILLSAPFMTSSLTLYNILRYEGKATLGMIGLLAGAVLNMAGDPILMFTCHLGITGAGISTAASQIISWGILLFMFCSGKTVTKLSLRSALRVRPSQWFNVASTGFPSLLRQGLNSLSTVILNSLCNPFGDAAVAAMGIVSRIIFFAFSIAIGVGQGFQPVAGFNFGAGQFRRLRKAFFWTLLLSEGIIVTGCILLIVFSGGLIRLFRDDPAVIEIGTRALVLQALAQLVLPFCMTAEMLFQSTGHRLNASLLSSLRNGVLFIPLLFLLAAVRGLSGIQEAQPAATVLALPVTIPFVILFFRRLPKEDRAEPAHPPESPD